MEDQFFDLSGRMGYIVDTDEYVESKLNYVLTQMLEKENPDFDPTVSIELFKLIEIICGANFYSDS